MAKIKIKQTRSLIGRTPAQRATMKALGFRKINHVVEHEDNAAIRGMIFKVKHMVEIVEQ